MKNDRSSKPRGKPAAGAARSGPRKPPRAFGDAGARKPPRTFGEGARKPPRAFGEGARRTSPSTQGAPLRGRPVRPAGPPRERGERSDPYQPARRPPREFGARSEGNDRFARGERSPRFAERTSYPDRGGRGFTVTLDPDVARVFRGDASVNRALRLVLQLMQVVQGPPATRGEGAPRGYQGTPEARGFTRKPRFEDVDAADETGDSPETTEGDTE
jgi:hypothetical protein